MDDLDTHGILAELDRQIAALEHETRELVARYPDDEAYVRGRWRLFNDQVRPMLAQREAIILAMTRVKSFETPAPIFVVSNPQKR